MNSNEICGTCYAESQAQIPFCLNCGARILGCDLPPEQSALASFVKSIQSAWLMDSSVGIVQQAFSTLLSKVDHTLSLAPREGKAWAVKGDVLMLLNQPDSAAVYFDRALVFDPTWVDAWVGKSRIALEAMKYSDAVEFADRALSVDPESVLSLICRSYGQLCLGHHDDALEIIDQALSIGVRQVEAVGDPNAHAMLVTSLRLGFAFQVKAHLLTARGEHDGAIKAFDQALELSPDDTGITNNRAALLTFLGRQDEILTPVQRQHEIQQPKASPVETVQPMSEAFSGNGQQASAPFKLTSGLARFQLTHSGRRNFAVWLLDSAGNRVALLANRVGSFNGSMAVGIKRSGVYLLNINADGGWTIQVRQP